MPTALRAETADPVAEIVHELETARTLPKAALLAAVEHAADIEPLVIQLAEQAANGVLLIPKQANLLFFGLHALAAARRTGIYKPLVRLVRQLPVDELEWLLGDATTETLASVMLGVFDGDTAPLIDATMDRSTGGLVRYTLWGVLARLTFDGAIERPVMLLLLDRFERESLAKPNDLAWKGWQQAIVLLGVEELRERMRATWADERNRERKIDQDANDAALSAAREAPPDDATRFVKQFLMPLDDPVEALARFEKVEDAEQSEAGDTISQDIGAPAVLAIDAEESEWLRRFLARSFGGADEVLEAIDGYYSGLIAGPEPASPREYVLKALDFGAGPRFDNAEQAEYVSNLLIRQWNTIAYRLKSDQLHRPALASGTIPTGTVWSASFLRAVTLRMPDWERWRDEELVTVAIQMTMMLVGRLEEHGRPLNRRMRGQLVAALPLMLRSVYDISHGRRDPLARPPLLAESHPRIGRNYPCPCGSGKKFKRCCGGADRRMDD